MPILSKTACRVSLVKSFIRMGGWPRLFSSINAAPPVIAAAKEPYFITTPIYYVNGDPHLGHAYTSVTSDVVARYQRNFGKNVFFLTGTDEHGQKVQQSASVAGESPQSFADNVSAKFRLLTELLTCSNDDFIRTTENRHKLAVATLWGKLEESGMVYLGKYTGWYSVRDESFFAEDMLIDGKAPTGADVEWIEEECYYFRLSAWTDRLLEYYKENPGFIAPPGRRNEVIRFLEQEGGLHDISISRTTFTWGIPVPNDPKHVMYVWLDALANYISAIGYPDHPEHLKVLWPAALHVIGKDILRFHAIYWPAFLMACGLSPPKKVFAHGWWTRDGVKMSKSIGNCVCPFELLELYGTDAVRYFLIAEIPFGQDGDFNKAAFTQRVNNDLANDIGNLAFRVLSMIHKNYDGKIPVPLAPICAADTELLMASTVATKNIKRHLENLSLHQTALEVIKVARLGNKYIDEQAPWKLLKSDKDRAATVLFVLAETIRRLSILLEPITPSACEALFNQLGLEPSLRTVDSLELQIKPGTICSKPAVVFPRILSEEKEEASKSKVDISKTNRASKSKSKDSKKSPQKAVTKDGRLDAVTVRKAPAAFPVDKKYISHFVTPHGAKVRLYEFNRS